MFSEISIHNNGATAPFKFRPHGLVALHRVTDLPHKKSLRLTASSPH